MSTTHVAFPNSPNPIVVKPYQIVVWVSVTRLDDFQPDPQNRFPAILDIGYSHNLSLSTQQLADWAHLNPSDLPVVGSGTVAMPGLPANQPLRASLHDGNVWLYHNVPGMPEPVLNQPPFDLGVIGGICLLPPGIGASRLPLLGLRAIGWTNLRVVINGHARYVSARSPFRITIS